MIPVFLLIAGVAAADGHSKSQVLPAQFVANLVYVAPTTTDGETLRFFTDSGGGLFIAEDAAKRLKLKSVPVTGANDVNAEKGPAQVLLPQFKAGLGIPLPEGGKIGVMPQEQVSKAHFVDDGMLGEAWFGGHVWTWDYPQGQLILQGSDWKADNAAKRVALGFPVDAKGERDDNFGRITIHVDGKPIDMLLDTGATTTLTADALKSVGDKQSGERATSFIVATQFDAWHKAHPEWQVIEKAEAGTNASVIEVPEVEIAGSRIGPVWFTWRTDKNFHEFMSSMMDKQVEGAIGGNALSHFVMTVDYPGAAAYFRCTRDCAVKPRSAP